MIDQAKHSVLLVGADEQELKKSLSNLAILGYDDVITLSKAKEAIDLLEQQEPQFLIIHDSTADMHWGTFIRSIQMNGKIATVPTILILKESNRENKLNLEHLSGEKLHVVIGGINDPSVLASKISQITPKKETIAPIDKQFDNAQNQYRTELLKRSERVYEQISTNEQTQNSLTISSLNSQYSQLLNLIDADPCSYNQNFERISLLIKHEQHKDAALQIDAVIDEIENAEDSWWQTQIGNLCISLRLSAFVEQIIENLGSDDSDEAKWLTHFLLARKSLLQNKLEEAEASIQKAQNITDGRRAELLNLLGIIMKRKGNYKKALECFKHAHIDQPGDHRLPYNIGLLYKTQQDFTNAKKYFEISFNMCPGYQKASEKIRELNSMIEQS